jgi:hypothetical protein
MEKSLSTEEERIGKEVVNAAYKVHKALIVNPVWEAQIISHLLLTGKRLGFLINFNVTLVKDGIRRYVNTR